MIYFGIIFIAVVGTSLHFLYELSHHNKLVAIFAAVNESVWEHIKICMTPTFIWGIYDFYMYGLNNNYVIAKSLSILVIILLIPILFYTYTAFTKKSILWIDVICFYITVICSQLVFYRFINIEPMATLYIYLAIGLLVIEILMYLTFTYTPMHNCIFEDPISHKYGIEGHTEMDHHNHKHK